MSDTAWTIYPFSLVDLYEIYMEMLPLILFISNIVCIENWFLLSAKITPYVGSEIQMHLHKPILPISVPLWCRDIWANEITYIMTKTPIEGLDLQWSSVYINKRTWKTFMCDWEDLSRTVLVVIYRQVFIWKGRDLENFRKTLKIVYTLDKQSISQ